MIVTMTKVAVIGPKNDLMELLGLVRRLGVLQLDGESPGRIEEGRVDEHLQALQLDREALTSRVYYQELRDKIVQLLGLLPAESSREPWLNPEKVRHSLTAVIDTHLRQTRDRRQRLESLGRESRELNHYREFLAAITKLLPDEAAAGQTLDHIGVEIRDEKGLAGLEQLGIKATGGCFELQTTRTASGRLVGVLTTEREFAEKIRLALQSQQVYDYALPSRLAGLPFTEQVAACTRLLAEHEAEISRLDRRHHLFAHRWLGVYRLVLAWLEEQLALLQATAAIHETEMCFVVSGWLPTGELEKLRERVAECFSGRVLVEEKAIHQEDLERVPTQLYNRGYFQPFELLTRLLPVPGYRSFDLTPIIGIFFPIFFGMMLGDLGYGLLLLLTALALVLKATNLMLRDVGKIFGVAAVYTMAFGLLFGEFFGALGKEFLGLKPIFLDRHTAMLPMFYFALAMGLVHILLGLALGAITSFRYGEKKEGWFKLISIIMVLAVTLSLIAAINPAFGQLKKPGIFVLLGAMPLLLITGGLLAPLEMLKHFGNIVSYARIMAIGLTSVLLAHVANSMVGMIGSLWLGVFAALLLHGFNIVLGIFAPTVHALRLHYVEFFSKIMTGGGQVYRPLARSHTGRSSEPPGQGIAGTDLTIEPGGKVWKA